MKKNVTLLTGFLGAGKTTFLNHLIEQNAKTRYAIIENEFGEQGIDSELILRPDDTIIELNNGCLCCTLNDNLYDILNELYSRKEDFDEVAIEATGVADPTGLAEPFVFHKLIKKHFPLKSIICLVDAELIEEQLRNSKEAIKQITFSDVLLINKTDLIEKEKRGTLQEKMRKINPLAKIIWGDKYNFPDTELLREETKIEDLLLQNGQVLKYRTEEQSFPVKKPHSHHHHHHTEEINSQTFIFDKPFDEAKLKSQLFTYLTLQAKDLYRMKGFVWIKNSQYQYSLQSVGKRLDFGENKPWANTDKQSVIVFIGKSLQRQGLERLLNRCLAK